MKPTDLYDRIAADAANEAIVTPNPYGGVQYGGTVVAKLEDAEMKRLLGLTMYYEEMERQARKIISENGGGDEEVYNKAVVDSDEYAALARAATTMFWYAVKKEHGLFGKYAVGVDENYQIYAADDPNKPCNCEACAAKKRLFEEAGFRVIDLNAGGEGLFDEMFEGMFSGQPSRPPIGLRIGRPISLADLMGMMGRRRR